jgi:hypothetical protein
VTFVLALALAVAAAIRSTWSPCGVSMLSTITPMTEAGRGHRFRVTAWWYVIGAIAGGAALGGVIAFLAYWVGRLDLSDPTRLILVAGAALIGVVSDGRLLGFQLPGHDRQVNEHWLDRYRAWVYGSGFGWQIGFGLSTYIMTSAVYLVVVVGALTGSVPNAWLLGILFGLIRGMAVFASGEIKDRETMAAFHRRFEQLRQPVRKATIAVIGVVGIVAGVQSGRLLGFLGAGLAAVALVASLLTTGETSYRPRQSNRVPA